MIYKKKRLYFNLNISDFFSRNQGSIIIIGFFILVGLFTGIFSGVKAGEVDFIVPFNSFSLEAYMNGELGTFSLFWQRFLSAEFILVICSFTYLSGWFGILGVALICYRSFLLGLNLTVMIVVFKALGSVTAVIFVFPFQLCLICLFSLLVILAIKNINRRRLPFCIPEKHEILKKIMCFSALIFVICMIETLILFLFTSKVILVI